MPEAQRRPTKLIAKNSKAYHEYFVEDAYEAGIELAGTEVKSLRVAACNLKESYCYILRGELFAAGIHISPYEKGNIFNRDPIRNRRLLMHKSEIMKLFGLVGREGYTLIPLSVYFKGGRVKVQIGLCKGKKLYDKREADAQRQAKRDIERHFKGQPQSE